MDIVTAVRETVPNGTRRHAFVASSATRPPPTVAGMERGQGTVEYLGLLAVLAVLLGLLALALSSDPPGIPWSHLLPSTRRARTPDERALRNAALGSLIAAAAPSLVLERDDHGDDLAIPVSDACRYPGCAAYGKARCVLYVHVVRSPERVVLEYWTYYPRSQTDHLPLRALQGFHDDDWEGLARGVLAGGAAARRTRQRPPRLERLGSVVGRAP